MLLWLAMLLPAMVTLGQTRTITGKVTEESGNPVPFATVRIQGAESGTSTDASGVFRLPVEDSVTAIVVSATGFVTQTVSIQGLETVNVILVRESGQYIIIRGIKSPRKFNLATILVLPIPKPGFGTGRLNIIQLEQVGVPRLSIQDKFAE